ncbi:MAG: WXG100 family type VII secretion target [Clostridiales bacterium]|jgi:WXG100 family type VII secretion target|nr:WXG100 family type VII secretion target [Clostridiales bacterium]MDR2751992.1 WXG100 family type VII secretion target [Clostridiales bacterium]
MATLIKAIPEDMVKTSNNLLRQIEQYESICTKVYAAKEEMQTGFKGEANQKFCARLEGFRNDLIEMRRLLTRYSEYIRDAAKLYADTENVLAQEAKSKLNIN